MFDGNLALAFNDSLADPNQALRDLDKFESEQSLINFMTLGWHTLEPSMPFMPNKGVYAICDHLEAVTSGQITRLLINVPPGCTKSMTTSVFWPAWEWGPKNLPNHRFINFSHEISLATRDNVRCRDLILSEWYQELWGSKFMFKTDQNAKTYYENNKTGWRQSCAAAGLTGKRGDRVIGDDPHSVKGAESDPERESVLQVVAETVPTRLNSPEFSSIIIIMQRVHERDTAGMIIAEELGYEHLMLPMRFEEERRCFSIVPPSFVENPQPVETFYDPATHSWRKLTPELEDKLPLDPIIEERYDVDTRVNDGDLLDEGRFPERVLAPLEKALSAWGGSYAVSGQMQQRPAPRGGGMFQRKDFNFIDDLRGFKFKRIVRGWDLAGSKGKTSPYTVGVKLGLTEDDDIVVLDVYRVKETPGLLEKSIKLIVKQDGVEVTQDMPQDPGQAGKSQKVAFTKLLQGYEVRFSIESGSKVVRATLISSQCENGNVYLLRADWNDTFINEATLFPNSVFKDQIDGFSRAYAALLRKRAIMLGSAPEVTEG